MAASMGIHLGCRRLNNIRTYILKLDGCSLDQGNGNGSKSLRKLLFKDWIEESGISKVIMLQLHMSD